MAEATREGPLSIPDHGAVLIEALPASAWRTSTQGRAHSQRKIGVADPHIQHLDPEQGPGQQHTRGRAQHWTSTPQQGAGWDVSGRRTGPFHQSSRAAHDEACSDLPGARPLGDRQRLHGTPNPPAWPRGVDLKSNVAR